MLLCIQLGLYARHTTVHGKSSTILNSWLGGQEIGRAVDEPAAGTGRPLSRQLTTCPESFSVDVKVVPASPQTIAHGCPVPGGEPFGGPSRVRQDVNLSAGFHDEIQV